MLDAAPGRRQRRAVRIGLLRNDSGGFADQAAAMADFESAGLDAVFVGRPTPSTR